MIVHARGSDDEELTVTDIFDELHWRGLIAQSTDEGGLRRALESGPVSYYVGFDPTAPSLHVGHLVQVLTARRLQDAGHLPLALVGGATGLVGDPRDTGERALNDEATVAEWVRSLRRQIEPFLDFDGPHAARMVNNLDWTAELSAIALLRDIGKHFPVNRMLDREAVAARLDAGGISYTEFSYVLLQSNDYLELFRRYGCALQLGGSDQWGNITAGCELIRRVDGAHVHAMATPLLTKADGAKFGKTESGTVWLDPELTSPYAFYQFWLQAEDAKIGEYLRAFSFRGRDEIMELERQAAEQPSRRLAQQALAEEVTALVHGVEHASAAVAASRALFGHGVVEALERPVLAAALVEAGAPTLPIGAELPTYAELFESAGLVASRSAARRAIAEGAAYVNNTRLDPTTDPADRPTEDDLLYGEWLVLRRGKRTVGGLRLRR